MMKPEEIRNATWEAIQGEIHGVREQVYQALSAAPEPLTTRALAERMGMDLLTVRPRITELVDLGLVVPAGHVVQDGKHQGLYQAVSLSAARTAHDRRHAEAVQGDQVTRRQGDKMPATPSPLHPSTPSSCHPLTLSPQACAHD